MKTIIILVAALLICQVASEDINIQVVQRVEGGSRHPGYASRPNPKAETTTTEIPACVMEDQLYLEGETTTDAECDISVVCRSQSWVPEAGGCLENCTIYAESEFLNNTCEKPKVCTDNSWEYVDGCLVDCNFYEEGETFEKECEVNVCLNENAVPKGGNITWNATLDEVGDITIYQERKNFSCALDYCNSLGGQLVVPSSSEGFQNLRNYLESINFGGYPFVGVRDDKWLDGRVVARDEWSATQPDEIPSYGYLNPNRFYMLFDSPVQWSGKHSFICQRK